MKPERGSWLDLAQQFVGEGISNLSQLTGGCVGQVYRINFETSRILVAKVVADTDVENLKTEGHTLIYLSENSFIPVPKVFYNDKGLLLMEYILSDTLKNEELQADCARHFVALHKCNSDRYGFEFDTVIGGLRQVNSWRTSWIDFFAESRIQNMAKLAREAGQLKSQDCGRIQKLCSQLDRWLEEPPKPALLHGDAWGGNILTLRGRLNAVIDPACYYGHPEVELAFTTMFSTFGRKFFEEYERSTPLSPGFFEERKDLYLIYPILVHLALFGGSYMDNLDRILRRYGF